MDHILWSMVVLVQYLTFHESVTFVLEDGTVLDGEVHGDWKKFKPVFKATCIDLQSAYRQLAVHPSEQKRAGVTLWDRRQSRPVYPKFFLSELLRAYIIFSGSVPSCKLLESTWDCAGQHTSRILLF